MNIAHLSGNLATDVELLRFDEKSLCKFTLASNNGDRVLFLPLEVWNQEHLSKFIHKGSRVLVSGVLKQDQWENEDGERRSRVVLVAHNVEFLDRKEDVARDGRGERSQSNRAHSKRSESRREKAGAR